MFNVKIYQPGNRILSAIDSVSLATWVSESLDNGSRHLAIDLQFVSFMDSRGLGALVLVHNRVEKAGGMLGICSVTGQAGMLLELTSMRNLFHVYDSVSAFKVAVHQRRSEESDIQGTAGVELIKPPAPPASFSPSTPLSL